MSWKPLKPARAAASAPRQVPVLALSGAIGRAPKTCLVVRSALLEDAAWVQHGTRLAVLEGEGEHAGRLRLEVSKGGAFTLANLGGRARHGALLLFLPWVAGATPAKQPSTPLDFDHGEGWLELTLPDWARAPSAPAAITAPPAARPEPARSGYQGVTARVADPAAGDRLAARRSGAL